MPELSRRKLLASAGGALGAASVASFLPPNLARAVAAAPKPGPLSDIKHVVILMQENRSFDHYFGTMPGVRGFDDPDMAKLPDGRSILYQPDKKNPAGYLLPFHLDTKKTNAQAVPSTGHAWAVQHEAWNHGKMDNWLPAHRKADGDKVGPYTMGYYTKQDIPFHFALASAFTLCDAYFCSLLGPTWPNRLYHWTGMIDPNGTGGGPITSNVVKEPYSWKTYPERLTENGISWHLYQEEDDYGCNPLEFFAAYQDAKPGSPLHKHGLTISPADRFAEDAKNDRLPTVSWIVPTSPQCEHPDYMPASGADFLARQLDAVAANPDVWNKTVFIVNYDENDGLFDHVIPPSPPKGTPDEFVDGQPIGAGVRVPCFIVSPWTLGGFVARERFDHTSVLRFLERITGVREPNISAWRRKTFGDLTSALGADSNRPFPPLPETKKALWEAEHDAATLPDAPIPGKHQKPPHQEHGPAPKPRQAGESTALGSRNTVSRLVESATTHRADFPDGLGETGFPGILAAAKAKPASAYNAAYVTGIVNNSISVIDTDSGKLDGGGIDAGTNPYALAEAGKNKLYVTNSGTSDVSIVDTKHNKINGSITVGLYPHGIVVADKLKHAYVANTGPDTGPGGLRTVSVIDTGADKVTKTLDVGLSPHAVALDPAQKSLYVTCFDGLAIVDTGTGKVRARHTDQARAAGVAVHPDGGSVYVVNTWQNTVSVLDTKTDKVRATVRVGETPWRVALSPDGNTAYVTNANDDTVSVIDTGSHKVTATITVKHIPTGITASAEQIWLTTNASSTVTAIDPKTHKITADVELGLSTEPSDVLLVKR
ncbi:alkaline phosphatase family protein [Sciscionella marina]|uniref:alkaline phosphatase family protein n=1 Tax=Sciscionella marina TaxID=508770 RepID=UPI00037B33A9|nr:alkaline phosphatase family protein [Sciscionella marina]